MTSATPLPQGFDVPVGVDGVDGVDVVVVGAGVAGAVAALRAREAGRSVLLVARAGSAGSATASWSGAVDVADEFLAATPRRGGGAHGLDLFDRGGDIDDAIALLAARAPLHPYARLGAARVAVGDALVFLKDAVPELGLVRRADHKNHVVATVAGTVKRAALVPESQHLDVAELAAAGAVVGVVEWRDLAGFEARSATAMLAWCASHSARALRLVDVVVPRVFADHEVFSSTTAFARWLDEGDHRARALTALRAALSSTSPAPTHLLTPAALSRAPLAGTALRAIDDAVGRPVRELLSLPPSVPGDRLARALRDACARAGVIVVDGLVDGVVDRPSLAGRRVVAVDILAGGERRSVGTGALVLASGRFYAGGLVRDGVAREALLGLPVVAGGVDVADRFVGDFVGDRVEDRHALFAAGLLVDDDLHPLGAGRERAFDNVVAAGSVIGGYDPARDGSALGVACWTGWLAGARAATVAS